MNNNNTAMPTSLREEPLFAGLDGLVWHELPPLAVRL
jgi:hypothetical protein